MDLGIAGRKAIVAGGSAGMGKQAALALARAGADLVVGARGAERLEAACAAIAADSGQRPTPVIVDLGDAAGRERLLEACPTPDILVLTVSPAPPTSDLDDIAAEDWAQALGPALIGQMEMIRTVSAGMAQRGFGRIVIIATIAAKTPSVWRVLSGAPRAALLNYMAAASKALAKDNVTLNAILPGMFDTEGARKGFADEAAFQAHAATQVQRLRIPAGRFGDPEDVGALCAFLCSRHAGYITGQSIVIDGGLTNVLF
ncbi:MAG: SDR family oxidoreductase [Alphaproteobacteria bacterium]|nr:SDR family oxidoreductase [Alphaproteobacteria bacterium]